MARLGMDADAVEQTAKELNNKAQELRQLMHAVDSKVNHLSSVWDGQDVKQFQSEWTGTRPASSEASLVGAGGVILRGCSRGPHEHVREVHRDLARDGCRRRRAGSARG